MDERKIIVGDVHGCLEEVKSLLKLVKWNAKRDRLIFIGDLINKGPFSYEVLKYVKKLKADVILGNHELNFLKAIDQNSLLSPLLEDLKIKMEKEKSLDQWLSWIESFPLFIEEEDFLAVHAGLAPHQHPSETSAHILTRIRTWDGEGRNLDQETHPPWFEFYRKEKLVIFGHWAKKGLIMRENAIGLDSGCVYGKELSALILPERKIFSVKAKKKYCPI